MPDNAQELTGVLAMQGAYARHRELLQRCGAPSIAVRTVAELRRCTRLILPGGESTAIYRLLIQAGLWQPLLECSRNDMPMLGTCAGMILLSSGVTGIGPPKSHPKSCHRQDQYQNRSEQSCLQSCLGAIDLKVRRNAYGPQIASFSSELDLPALAKQPAENPDFQRFVLDMGNDAGNISSRDSKLPLIFIRAPLAVSWGPKVQVLLRFRSGDTPEAKDQAICLQQDRVLVCSFHPELSKSTLLHRYFLSL